MQGWSHPKRPCQIPVLCRFLLNRYTPCLTHYPDSSRQQSEINQLESTISVHVVIITTFNQFNFSFCQHYDTAALTFWIQNIMLYSFAHFDMWRNLWLELVWKPRHQPGHWHGDLWLMVQAHLKDKTSMFICIFQQCSTQKHNTASWIFDSHIHKQKKTFSDKAVLIQVHKHNRFVVCCSVIWWPFPPCLDCFSSEP